MEVGLARLARPLGQRDESVIKCHVFIRKFHPVYRDNFAVLTLFKQLLKIANRAVFDLFFYIFFLFLFFYFFLIFFFLYT